MIAPEMSNESPPMALCMMGAAVNPLLGADVTFPVFVGALLVLCNSLDRSNWTSPSRANVIVDWVEGWAEEAVSVGVTAEAGDGRLGEDTSGGGRREAGAGEGAMEVGCCCCCMAVLERVEKEVAMLWERVERLSPGGRAMERGGRWEEDEEEGGRRLEGPVERRSTERRS